MALSEQIAGLASDLRKNPQIAKVRYATFPSGAISLDVWINDRMFVLHYFPTGALFGVDEVKDADGIGNEYRYRLHDFDAAKSRLLSLLNRPSRILG